VHVLAHVIELPSALRARAPGLAVRVGLVGTVVAAGALLATNKLPGADRLQDQTTAHVGIDAR